MNTRLKTVVSLALFVVLSASPAMAGRGGGGGGGHGGGGASGSHGGGGGGVATAEAVGVDSTPVAMGADSMPVAAGADSRAEATPAGRLRFTRLLSARRVRVTTTPHVRVSITRVWPRRPRFGRRCRSMAGPTARLLHRAVGRAPANGLELPTRPIGTTA